MIRDFSCLVCLILFLISNAVHIVSIVNDAFFVRKAYDEKAWFELDPNYLEDLWDERRSSRFLALDVSVLSALAWFSLVMPVTQASYLLSDGGTRLIGLHISIVALVLGASMSELLSHMMDIGLDSTIRWLVNNFNLTDWGVSEDGNDGVGWRVIEILHVMGKGLVIWVDAFEWLALAAITFFISLSIRNEKKEVPTFSAYFGGLSAAITIFSFVTFASNIFKLTEFTTWVPLTISTTVFNSFILVPMWLLNLSGAIPAARARYEVQQTERNGEEVDISRSVD